MVNVQDTVTVQSYCRTSYNVHVRCMHKLKNDSKNVNVRCTYVMHGRPIAHSPSQDLHKIAHHKINKWHPLIVVQDHRPGSYMHNKSKHEETQSS